VAVSAFVVATGLTMRLFLCPADDRFEVAAQLAVAESMDLDLGFVHAVLHRLVDGSFQAFADVATLAEQAFEASLDVAGSRNHVWVDGYPFRLFELNRDRSLVPPAATIGLYSGRLAPPPLMHTQDAQLRIAFVNLHARDKGWQDIVMVPLGVMYLSAAIKQEFGTRIAVSMHDMTITPHDIDLEDAVAAYLADVQPDVVGVRGFTSQADEFGVIARVAKRINPGCQVLVGGPHASTKCADLFHEDAIDFVIINEGEQTLIDLLAKFLDGGDPHEVPGIGWSQDGEKVFSAPRTLIQNLDALPFPDYSILNLDAYQNRHTMTCFPPRERFTSLFTSRGCHYQCSFCHEGFGKSLRYRSVENVIAEMRYLIEEQGVREFHIIDDIFNADRKRSIAIFDRIVAEGWDIGIAFPNGLRGDILNEEFIVAARAAGTYYLALAVESATPRIQKMVRKFNRLEKLRETIDLCADHKILTTTFNMLGFPTETREEMMATVQFNLESRAHVAFFFMVTPFEGTRLYESLQNTTAAVLPSEAAVDYSSFANGAAESFMLLPPDEVQEIAAQAQRDFYFSPQRLERLVALTNEGHSAGHLAFFMYDRMWSTSLTLDSFSDPRVRPLLETLFAQGKRDAPEMCEHIPLVAS
jgi:anaerobic magnesium-protoporphyrin IX monomethyl ester cyclase